MNNFDNQPYGKIKNDENIYLINSISFKDGRIDKISINGKEYLPNEVKIIYKNEKLLQKVDNEYIEKCNEILKNKFNNFHFAFFDGFYSKGVILKQDKTAVMVNVEMIDKLIEDLENIGLKVFKFYVDNLKSFYICLEEK
jgi:hypothetical protein